MINFSKQLGVFSSLSAKRIDEVLRRSALDVLGRVTIRSPVDTGRFRANWAVGINGAGASSAEASKEEGFGNAIQDGQRVIAEASGNDAIFITNNLPYAEALEDGHSSQAPHGMVAITVAEWSDIVDDALEASR